MSQKNTNIANMRTRATMGTEHEHATMGTLERPPASGVPVLSSHCFP
jgi:hypothetical protein